MVTGALAIDPDAELKLYFDASAEVRARRRWQEIQARGEEADYEAILASMRRRDRIDSGREHAPLRPAHDAIMVDTSDLTVDEVQALVTSILTESLPDNSG